MAPNKMDAASMPPKGQPQPRQLNLSDLPPGSVALNVFRVATEYGPDPMTVVVSRESYDRVRKLIEQADAIDPSWLFVLESPLSSDGRKTVLHLTRVVSIVAFINTSIVPGVA